MDMFPVTRNKVFLLGYLGEDARQHPTDDGVFFNFRVATTERIKTDSGSKEQTEWHSVAFWVKAPVLRSYYEAHLVKGAGVDIEGKLTHERYVDAKGNNVKATLIKAAAVQILCKPKESESERPPEPAYAAPSNEITRQPVSNGFSTIPPSGPLPPEW